MITGKEIRIKRLLPNGKGVILALDHGFSMGSIQGLENLDSVVRNLCEVNISGIVINYGALKNLELGSLGSCKVPIIVHLCGSGLGEYVKEKLTLYKVKDALRLGADAVSLQINFGTTTEREQISAAAAIIAEADSLGIPVLLMMYISGTEEKGEEKLEDIVRLGIELGADIIKIDGRKNFSLMRRLSENSKVPILVAGGELSGSEKELKQTLAAYLESGSAGVSIGRNVFQSKTPKVLLTTICKLVYGHRG